MVFHPDTIIDPLTVMVKSFDTLVTNVAMSGVLGANHLAFRAEQVGFKLFHETYKWHVRAAPHEAGLHLHCQDEENHRTKEKHEEQREPSIGVYV